MIANHFHSQTKVFSSNLIFPHFSYPICSPSPYPYSSLPTSPHSSHKHSSQLTSMLLCYYFSPHPNTLSRTSPPAIFTWLSRLFFIVIREELILCHWARFLRFWIVSIFFGGFLLFTIVTRVVFAKFTWPRCMNLVIACNHSKSAFNCSIRFHTLHFPFTRFPLSHS